MSKRLTTWFNGDPGDLGFQVGHALKRAILFTGVAVLSMVDSAAATYLALRIGPYTLKKNTSVKMTSPTNSIEPQDQTLTQHFYLRLLPEVGHNPNHKTHPVGVLVVQGKVGSGKVKVAGSLVSKNDTFLKKVGVARAYGRLESESLSAEYQTAELACVSAATVAAELGLFTQEANHFLKVDWKAADALLDSFNEKFNPHTGAVLV